MKKLSPVLLVMVALFLSGLCPALKAQNSLNNLVGARGSSVEGEMDRLGYVFIRSDKSTSGINEFWWKKSNNKCTIVRLYDGKVAAVTNTVPDECNQGGYSSNNNNNNYGNGSLQNLVGARGSSLDGEMNRMGYTFIKSDKSTAGIYTSWWNNSQRKCVMSRLVDGKVASIVDTGLTDCNKGNYSSNNKNNNKGDYNYNPNYTGNTKLGDLVGWTAGRAYNEIGSRGYRNVKDYRNNGKLVKVWYNSKYNQCKKTAEKDGKIDLIDNSKQCN